MQLSWSSIWSSPLLMQGRLPGTARDFSPGPELTFSAMFIYNNTFSFDQLEKNQHAFNNMQFFLCNINEIVHT